MTCSAPAGVKYGARNVLADAALREGIKKFTSWPTIPQVGLLKRAASGHAVRQGRTAQPQTARVHVYMGSLSR